MKTILFSLLLLCACSTLVFSQDFYDTETINTIEITFSVSNWDQILDTYYSNDNDEMLMGSAEINGIEFDSIGVRFKGNSTYSSSNAKNPLHIELDYLINQDYDGYETIKLSNGKNDPSFVREVLSYEIARKYMDAPLSNYTKVYINGSYYGMFSSSEAINGDFVEERLDADSDNTRIKCNPESTSSGNGSSLEYLGTSESSYYEYYELKSDEGWQDLIDFTWEIKYNPSEIESILDIDKAIWMLAFDNVLVNLDSYIGPFRQNYYLVKDDNDLFIPVVWDLNESLGAFENIDSNTSTFPGGKSALVTESSELSELNPYLREDDDTYPLMEMIFDNDRYKKMYIAHCRTMLEENFESGWYETEANTLQSLIADDLDDDPNAYYSMSQFYGNIDDTEDNTIGITELMEDRITYLNKQTAFNYTQPTISNITSPEDITPYSTVTITAEISDANYVELGYRYSKDETFTKIQMYDDGDHDDGSASDNVYGTNFVVDESNTHYYIYAENDDAGKFSPIRAQFEYYKITAVAEVDETDDIVINELMASNTTNQEDQDGEFDDWIELYNNTDSEISLLGYYLSDDESDVVQWAFPDTSIAANDYLIVWADNDEEQTGLHAGFKLSASGESLYLSNSEFVIVNSVTFEEQTEDMGYARYPNGTGDFVIQDPTFSTSNNGNILSIENNGLSLIEGETVSLTTSELTTFDSSDENSDIVFSINENTTNGILQHTDFVGVYVTSFTQQDLVDEKIQYVHDGSNTISDEFTFTVSDNSTELNDLVFNITITAVDDDAPTLVTNTGLTLNEEETATISSSELLASDTESDDTSLLYNIDESPVNGTIINSDDTSISISSFTQQQIIDGEIQYLHDGSNTTSDSFTFTVSDGENELNEQEFTISINPVDDDAPTIVANNTLSVNEGDTATILSSKLLAYDAEADDTSILFIIDESTINGSIINSDDTSTSISSFSQQQIKDGEIQYAHDGSNTSSDSFTFTVSDGTNELNNQSFSITISSVNDDAPYITVNNTLSLNEGESSIISNNYLSSSDLVSADSTLLFTISDQCLNGQIENIDNEGNAVMSFTLQNINDEKIQYVHDGSNTTFDSFIFSVSDGQNELSNQSFNIIITAIDDDAPYLLVNESLQLDEGSSSIISSDILSASDTEVDDALLTYTITGLCLNGQIENIDNSGVSIDTFTEQNIIDNKIQYIHDGSNTTSDEFTFTVSDEQNELTDQTLNISITAIDDDAPTLTVNNTLTLDQGSSALINTDVLSASDTEADNTSLLFTITTEPLNGHLANINNSEISITSFTLQNLSDGDIIYVHDGTDTDYDSFIFTLSDGFNEITDQTFSIEINLKTLVDDLTTEVSIQVYPNPASTFLYVKPNVDLIQMVFYKMNGSKGDSYSTVLENENKYIDVSTFQNGIYFLKMQTENGIYTKKIIIQ
jgi:hypothetical protein